MKRILTIQDISCLGKCSLTVALPIISAMGVECAILPTAVLSAHTVFRNFTCKDLTDQVRPITAHWKQEDITFDAIYTGYLGSFEQIDLMKELFANFKTEQTMTFVDPAMADHGRLYPAFDEAFARHMATLCAQADIIVPNITEACFMTGTPYREEYDEGWVCSLLEKTAELGAGRTLLTGVSLSPGQTGIMGYDRRSGERFTYQHHRLPAIFHGTGDIFSSTCVGALVTGSTPEQAAAIAADYTYRCIEVTMEDPNKPWYGVNFEQAVPYLLERMKG